MADNSTTDPTSAPGSSAVGDQLSETLWIAGPDGTILSVSPEWPGSVDIAADAEPGKSWLTAIHPDDLEATRASWTAALETGDPADVEFRLRQTDGTYRWMRGRATPHRAADGQIEHWYGILLDIHQRRLTEAALRASEALSRSILDASDMAIEVLDVNGALIFVNRPGLAIMEVEDFEAIRNRPFSRFWPDNVRPVIREAIVAAREGRTVRHTLYGPTAKGAPRWWDISISPIYEQGQVVRLLALSRDVSEAKQNELEVSASARRLNRVLESTMDKVISIDFNWRITYLNRRAMAVLPRRMNPFVGKDFREVFDREAFAPFLARYEKVMSEQGSLAFEEYLSSTDTWYEVQAYGTESGLIIFFRNISERRRAQQQVVHMARHDGLTGLANRASFREELEVTLAGRSDTATIAILSIDLDDFKQVNDTLGHQIGDELLSQVSERMRRCIRETDMAARLGGDEFAVLLRLSRPEDAGSVARSILTAMSYPFETRGEMLHIGASIGISVAPRDGTITDVLLHHADVALYRVKADGGRDYRFFEPQMDRALQERRQLKHSLAQAVERRDLTLVFQPQVNVERGRLIGFEALLRWHTADGGSVSPATFIPLAEESGLIDPLGQFVLEEACTEAAKWPGNVTLAVNVSPAQFRSRKMVGLVEAALLSSGLPAERLELEITESVLFEENSQAVDDLTELHKRGVTVALDDFGTGYSSLSYLQKFPFDKIKIDGSFVRDLPSSQQSKAIVRAIIGLGRSLNIRVVAEGVESWEQLLALRSEGCHEAQGYLFSQPVSGIQAGLLARTGFVKPAEQPAARRLS